MLSFVRRSFNPRRQIVKDSKHHCEGNNCLKEIVSNTKLDMQTDFDYFFWFFPANVLIAHLLLGLFYITVLKRNTRSFARLPMHYFQSKEKENKVIIQVN